MRRPRAASVRSRTGAVALVVALALVAELAGVVPARTQATAAAPVAASAIPKPAVPVEVDRTATTVNYANPDATRTTYAYSRPVNYRTADGAWQKIDPTIVDAASGLFKNAAG